MSASYCDLAADDPLHGPYHDREYGFPIMDETRLFERLGLEIFQAGLNWGLILKKRDGFLRAFDDFAVDRVAEYGTVECARLLDDAGIIRNRLKINAIIHNARVLRNLRDDAGGFANWLAAAHPLRKPDWVKLFRRTFKFTGGEITGEFLLSTGYLPGAHHASCPVYKKIAALDPPWMQAGIAFYGNT